MKKLLPLLLALAAVSAPAAAGVRISEVGSAVTDPWGNATSFVELYNAGDEAAPLEGWAIRRTQKGKTKEMALPACTLAAGAYAVVWGSDDFPYEGAYLVYDTGLAEKLAWNPDEQDVYCTVVTATDLKAARWDVVSGTSTLWKELGENAEIRVDSLDTTSSPVRFFRIAVTPYALSASDSVTFGKSE